MKAETKQFVGVQEGMYPRVARKYMSYFAYCVLSNEVLETDFIEQGSADYEDIKHSPVEGFQTVL